ncbi:MAG TPA: IS110 family transposase [Thermoanaerobaculia bacterium]|nr:IS110 family transposase [Thermoanaerobaculia bacterium]
MQVLCSRCAGLDVHKDTVVASARLASGRDVSIEVRTFATTTAGLLALSARLAERGCTHAAMEATGVHWKPVWHVLADGDFTLVLANAAQVKNVPGRKTDVADATWLAELLAHGLVRASFVPDAPTQALRALLRTRKQLVRERASHVQRLQKTLEGASIKLSSVLADVTGVSGRAIVEALVAGETDPATLAALAHRRVKAPREKLEEALRGRITAHHRFLLRLHLRQIDALEAAIGDIDREVEADLEPFRAAVRLLSSIPGVSALSAEVIVAEIGTEMGRFPSAGHLLSWAGLCPRSDESAGKRRSTRLRHGAPWLKTTLVQCAWAAARKKGGYLQAQFQRLRARRGPKKAICAVAASILTAAYHMLRDGTFYQDLGPDHFSRRTKGDRTVRLVRHLTTLGYTIQPLAQEVVSC